MSRSSSSPSPSRFQCRMVALIRMIHAFFALFFLGCIGELYYSVLTRERSLWSYGAIAAILVEGLLLLHFGECPLGSIHRRFGDARGFFDLFLPERVLPYVIPFFVGVVTLGILLLFRP